MRGVTALKKKKITDLLIFIVSAELIGVLSAILSGSFSQTYLSLERPPLSPPGWVFPVVWGILYAVMGISAYLVYISQGSQRQRSNALKIYTLQLFFNFLWSIIFFRFELYTVALIDIILLDFAVVVMTVLFYRLSKAAGYMNIPYLIWLLFATYLNAGVVILN
ncbi:MAG: tryptophan-rich sensory protein [Oscillospiraceae bacterium]|nr:tryptophan-rich sensory protein [Oscillospiraceae bacterium]